MDVTAALALAVGQRVRGLRQSRRWTLEELASATGLSRRALVTVEQGATNPSLGTLLRLSAALGVGLPALVEPPAAAGARVVRAGEGTCLWAGEHGGRGVLVAATAPPAVVELWDWTLAPGDRHDSGPHALGTGELLQVQEGEVTVTVGPETHLLGPGDAVGFPGDVPHGYACAGTGPARFTLTVHEPGASPRTKEPTGAGRA